MAMAQVTPEMWIALGVMLTLLVGGAIAAITFNLRQHGKLVAQFRRMGEKYELELTVPEATMGGLYRRSPTLYGRYRGHELSIFPKGYGLDNTRQTDTAVRVSTRVDQKLHLTLAKRNISGKLGQIGRLKEVKTGDAAFDEAFSLRSNDPEQAVEIFDEKRRAALQREWPHSDSFFTLQDGIITHLRFGLPYEDDARQEIEAMVDFCVALSDEI